MLLRGQGTDLELGITGGTTVYVGDLSGSLSQYAPQDLGWTGGIFLRSMFNRHLGVRFGLQYARIQADELNRRVPNPRSLNFNNDLKQAFLLGEWRIINFAVAEEKILFSPFIAAGGNFQLSDPRYRDLTYGNIRLRALGTQGQGIAGYPDIYPSFVFSVPVGMGLSVMWKRRLTLTAELIGNRVFSDFIDDVSDAPVLFNDLLANPLGPINAYNHRAFISNPILYPNASATPYTRGGPAVDWYYWIQFTMSYRIRDSGSSRVGGRRGTSCPTFW